MQHFRKPNITIHKNIYNFNDSVCVNKLADACECGNEPSGSVKCGEFFD